MDTQWTFTLAYSLSWWMLCLRCIRPFTYFSSNLVMSCSHVFSVAHYAEWPFFLFCSRKERFMINLIEVSWEFAESLSVIICLLKFFGYLVYLHWSYGNCRERLRRTNNQFNTIWLGDGNKKWNIEWKICWVKNSSILWLSRIDIKNRLRACYNNKNFQ